MKRKDELLNFENSDGNISGEVARLRDAFFGAERKYINSLLENDLIREKLIENRRRSTQSLVDEAKELIMKIETGEVPEDKLELVELKIILLLAAIQDKVLVREKILTPDKDSSKR